MIKIIKGRYGPSLLGPDTILNLEEQQEQRLIKLGVAVLVGDNEDTEADVNNTQEFLSEEEISKFKNKADIVKYAESIGLELNLSDKKEDLIREIVLYIEELEDTVQVD